MPEVFDWPTIDRLPNPVRCPWCGSKYTSMARGPQRRYYCHSCFRSFEAPADVAYDVIADEWTPALAALQAAGELIAVRLGAGFYGICLLGEVSELETAVRPRPNRPFARWTGPPAVDHDRDDNRTNRPREAPHGTG